MKKHMESLDPELQSVFERTRAVPERDANSVQQGRANFLRQAQELGQPVSLGQKRRHMEWFKSIQSIRRESFTMLTTILVILGLLFGGSGATVYAAQGSMPGEFLYPVKAWSENARSDLTTNPEARYQLMLQLAEQRTEEIQFMAQNGALNGVENGDQQIQRLQLHLDEALRQMSRLQDKDMEQALDQMRDRLRQQDQTLQQTQLKTGPQAQAVLMRARTTLQTRQQWVDAGLADPQDFRWQAQNGFQYQRQQGQPDGASVPTDETEEAVVEAVTEDALGASNPWTNGTPTPGSGYGEGSGGNPWTDGTPTPGSGYGEGSGGNPWTDTTPTPGSGYGPGPGTDGTCTGDCDGSPNPGNPDNGGNGGGSTNGGGSKK